MPRDSVVRCSCAAGAHAAGRSQPMAEPRAATPSARGARARSYNPGPPSTPAPGGHRDPAARRRARRSRCCSSGARRRRASWAACGCSPAAPSTRERGRRRRARTARPRSASCARRPRSSSPTRRELVKFSRWITPAQVQIRFDTHFFLAALPDGPGAAHRRRGVRRPRLVHARRARSTAHARERSCSCSRRSSTSSS